MLTSSEGTVTGQVDMDIAVHELTVQKYATFSVTSANGDCPS